MKKLYKTLKKIKERPGLYLGRKSLMLLDAFLGGYSICCYDLEKKIEADIFDGFQEYIQQRYNIRSTQSWAKIIDFYSLSDEEAFDNFYNLYEEFLKEHPENLETK